MYERGSYVLKAAGGVLVRRGARGTEIAVVYRRRYDEWGLPKGKLEPGEEPLDAALREVREETGYDAAPVRFVGTTRYRVGATPKEVSFWLMEPRGDGAFAPSEEVQRVEWLPIDDAIERLRHDQERRVVRAVRDSP